MQVFVLTEKILIESFVLLVIITMNLVIMF